MKEVPVGDQRLVFARRVQGVTRGVFRKCVLPFPWLKVVVDALVLAEVAQSVVAVDASRNMLEKAGQRLVAADNVELALADAYKLDEVAGTFDAAVANFWLSHVPKARLSEFLEGLHRRLASGSVIFMADNVYREGRGGELIQPEGRADSYKRRKLENGAEYEILKNYYDRDALEILFAAHADSLNITTGQYSWWVRYSV